MRILTVLLLLLGGWAHAQTTGRAAATPQSPFTLGTVVTMQSKQLGEQRTLNIYLPDGYSADDTTRYPVIYLLDGAADEDFIHVVGLVQFCSMPWVNRWPPSIVVGIANVDRRRDFSYPTTVAADRERYPTTGKSAQFIAFIAAELQPMIAAKYRVTDSKTLIGQSLGGLLATEILFTQPALFNQYIIISPSLWWDNGSLLDQNPAVLEAGFQQQTTVYIGVGKEGLTPSDVPRVMEVDANLLAEKIAANKSGKVRVLFDYLPDEDHATIGHQAVYNAFRIMGRGNGGK